VYKTPALPLCYSGLLLVLAALRTPWLPVGSLATPWLLSSLLLGVVVAAHLATETLLYLTTILAAFGSSCIALSH
jgi:hypothetical protein